MESGRQGGQIVELGPAGSARSLASWSTFMDMGIIHCMIYPEVMRGEGPVVETATKIAADDFFDVIEITFVKDPAVRAELRHVLDVARMKVGFSAQPGLLINGLNLADLDEPGRQAAVAKMKEGVEEAYFYGARIMALFDGSQSYPGPEKAEQATDQLVKSLGEICQYAKDQAEDYLLAISLEAFDREIEKRSLMGPSPEVAEMARRVKESHDNFGLTIDLSHLPLLGESPLEALTTVQDHVIHIHVGNAYTADTSSPAYGDQHPRFGLPGSPNDVPQLVEFLEALFSIGYFEKDLPTLKPIVSFEVKPLPGESPELVIANCKRVMKEAWARL
jgi:sugar phosphate isomerase/epimerase